MSWGRNSLFDVPTGVTFDFPSTPDKCPAGYLICGQNVSRSEYAELFKVIGTIWGVGDGSTTFALPPNGVVYVGLDTTQTEFNTVGKKGGSKTHTLTTEEIPAHNHANGSFNQLLKIDGTNTTGMTDNSSGEPRVNASGVLQTVGGGKAHNNLQPYAVVLKIIKY